MCSDVRKGKGRPAFGTLDKRKGQMEKFFPECERGKKQRQTLKHGVPEEGDGSGGTNFARKKVSG